MATENLTQLRDKLYTAFDYAIERSRDYNGSSNNAVESSKAAAELAKAIVAVETRLDERAGLSTLKMPGKP